MAPPRDARPAGGVRRRPRTTAFLAAVLSGALALAACGGGGSGASAGSTEWQRLSVTDVEGEAFAIDDFAGTPVFVETFATWCSTCFAQLGDTQAAAAGDDAVFVALSVETDIDPGDVAAYATENGFDDIRFAVMTPEMLAAFDDAYGSSALNPPSTPKVVVGADGEAGDLVTGRESPDEIAAALDTAA